MEVIMKKTFAAGACLLLLLLILFSGCRPRSKSPAETENARSGNAPSGQAEAGEEAVLTLFDKNSDRHSFDDRIAQEIMRRTGCASRSSIPRRTRRRRKS